VPFPAIDFINIVGLAAWDKFQRILTIVPELQRAIEARPHGAAQYYSKTSIAILLACILTQGTEEVSANSLQRGVSHSALVAALAEVSRRLALNAGAWRDLALAQIIPPDELAGYMGKVKTNSETSAAFRERNPREPTRAKTSRARKGKTTGLRGEKSFFRTLANAAVKREKSLRHLKGRDRKEARE
jgi:hypothetical protein